MKRHDFPTPILFIAYNRILPTKKVLQKILSVSPQHVYIAYDGWKDDAADKKRCQQVRRMVGHMTRNHHTTILFQSSHLGCKKAVSSAIRWFFTHVPEGIILEDDCLPDASFFTFCQRLLKKYRTHTDIMHISGDNYQKGRIYGTGSYFFSRMPYVWGWATWRRAWKFYDIDMKSFPQFQKHNTISTIFSDTQIQKYFLTIFNKVYRGIVDTWDYQWTYTIWNNHGVCIVPQINLVANIGFDADATHTHSRVQTRAGTMTTLIHPKDNAVSDDADVFVYELLYKPTFYRVVRHLLHI